MKKQNSVKNGTNNGANIKQTLDRLADRRKAPFAFFVVLLILYVAANALTTSLSGVQGGIPIGDSIIPFSACLGVISSLGNICVILMTVYYGKIGYFTSLILLLVQFPSILMGIIMGHNMASIPGIFTNLLTIIAITIIYLNNSRLDQYQDRLREQAVTDMLTGLPNRFACSELIAELIRREEPFALVSIDLNNFKSINDTMGFDTGNTVLKQIASRWKTVADTGISGTNDFIARIGGDEFMLVMRDYRSEEDVVKSIKQYETLLGNRLTVDGYDFYITASFGYAFYPTDTDNKDKLGTFADAAVNELKRANSSNHILHFTPDLLKMERTIEIENKIRTALDHDTIYFHLQPQYNMDHKLRGFEALARMKDDDGKFISPGEFIPVAEKVGLIDKVDGTVFRKSAAFFGKLLKASGMDHLTLSINVSVRHLMKNDFLDEIRTLLETSGVPAGNLEIEITESIMIDSVDKALQCIEEVRKMGIQLAIDDFGTGYSSLSYLSSFPANLLKIDKSFIDKMNGSDSSRQYVAAIISIGHIMGFEVISEGVETPDQLDTLREIGCDFIQGFIWGRPLPQEEAETLVMEAAKQA